MKRKIYSPPATRTIELVAEQKLHVTSHENENELCLTDNTGKRVLSIKITESGPILNLDTQSLTIRIQGELTLEAEHLKLHGHRALSLSSGGDLKIQALGDVSNSGRAQRIEAQRGNVDLKANDDVTLDGLRIRLNC
jgi:hypothetical protein